MVNKDGMMSLYVRNAGSEKKKKKEEKCTRGVVFSRHLWWIVVTGKRLDCGIEEKYNSFP